MITKETARMITSTVTQLPAPLATDADTATTSTARCRLCRRTILRGERYARLAQDGQPAHIHCIGQMAAAPRARGPVIW